MAVFSPEHPIEAVRNQRLLSPSQVRRALTRRATYLTEQVRHRQANGQEYGLFLDELRAIVQVMEAMPPCAP